MIEHDHIKPDDIAAPIDIRLIPAATLTAGVCFLIPMLPMFWVRWIPVALPFIGGIAALVLWFFRSSKKRRLVNLGLIFTIACWMATPAACIVQHQRIAAEDSGWLQLVEDLGTARMSVQLVTDPVERDSPFGPNWFVTAKVEHFGKDLVPTDHPAKIVVSGDETWADLSAEDHGCFMGRVSDNESSVFVTALGAVNQGTCLGPDHTQSTTGRDQMRTTLRDQSAETIAYAPELLPGLILGDRSQQSEHLDEAMKISGLSHLSAVSGAHTSLIAAAATLLFRSLRLPRSIVIAAFFCTLLLFVQIVGMQPSIIRAATMGAIGAWALYFGRGSQALPVLALSTIVILTISPELVHEVGFQLSVAATAGIVLGAQPLERWLHRYLNKVLPDFWASMLSSSLAISTTAQLACQPILLSFIDYISPYSLLANLLATPLLPLITVPGTLAAGISVVAPAISQTILHLVAIPTSSIGWVATTVTDLPGAKLAWPDGIAGVLLITLHWAACAIFIVRLLRSQRRPKPPVKLDERVPRWRRSMHSLYRQHQGVTSVVQSMILVIAVVAHVAVFWPSNGGGVDDNWDIIGCDVGQGDMFLIRTGAASAMVIDTGPDEALAQRCLADANIETIDALAVTHLHADHVGGIGGVTARIQPAQVLYSTGADPTYPAAETGLPDDAQHVKEPVVQVIDHAADQGVHSVQVRWTVLSADSQTSNENNASMVLLVEIYRHGGTVKALFTGDLEEDAAAQLIAQDLVPEDIDILKLSHHGAQNGGTELIQHTAPKVAMIGVGAENSYGHPHDDILSALGANVEIRRTDLDGTFSVTFEQNQTYMAVDR